MKEEVTMRQSRWQPFSPLWNDVRQFQEEMNRVFNRWTTPFNGGGRGSAAFPLVNIWDDADNVYVEAELPGIDPQKVDIQVTGNFELTIKGERQPLNLEKGTLHRQERGIGKFARILDLPFHVDADKVQAKFEKGVLTIVLAKHAAAKPRKITVKSE
jgi:HSP20 family protein